MRDEVEKLEIDMSVIKVEELTESNFQINAQYFRLKKEKTKKL